MTHSTAAVATTKPPVAKAGSPRNGNSAANHLCDVITAEVIDETFAKLFAFE